MARNILFIIDEPELKYFEFYDLVTNFWFIKEFLKRGYNVYASVKGNLFTENSLAYVLAHNTFIKDENIFYNKEKIKFLINDFDVVFFRPDPPVDINYINACNVFDYVDKNKTLLINDPCAIRDFNEKFHINKFPNAVPENIVTSIENLIVDFVEKNSEAILKPLNRCFGSGVYYLNKNDKNLLTVIKNMTEEGKTAVMVQKYIPKAEEGDKRILIIGKTVLDECIQKLPGKHNFKFSVHSDEYFKSAKLTEKEKFIAQQIADDLSEKGLNLIGLDVIDEKVIEINVTSPCYFIREINQHYNIRFEDKIIDCLEKMIEKHFLKERVYAVNR